MPSIFVARVSVIGREVSGEAERESLDFLDWENEIPFNRVEASYNEIAFVSSV